MVKKAPASKVKTSQAKAKPIAKGTKGKTCLDLSDKKGSFMRKAAAFRNTIGGKDNKFQPEKGRYTLYISWACPWAHRCAMVRHMKGLNKAIDLSVVHPTW